MTWRYVLPRDTFAPSERQGDDANQQASGQSPVHRRPRIMKWSADRRRYGGRCSAGYDSAPEDGAEANQFIHAFHLASLSASHLSAASSGSMPSMSASLAMTAMSRLVKFILRTISYAPGCDSGKPFQTPILR